MNEKHFNSKLLVPLGCILLLLCIPTVAAGLVQSNVPAQQSGTTADFTYAPSSPNPDDEITLDASKSSSTNSSINSYQWDGDGDGQYSEYRDPTDGQTSSISFNTAGTYTVGLRVVDDSGTEQTVTKQITVENPTPTVKFTYTPSSPNPDDEITLDASESSDSDGTITSYKWDGDGDGQYSEYRDPSDGQTSSITFGSAGTYTVGLQITDNGDATQTTTKQITVKNPGPTAEFTYTPSSPNPDDKITLDASGSSDSDGTITSYEWDGDGDGQYSEYRDPSDGQTSSITFGSAGTYTVGLRITDNGGTKQTITKQITVKNPSPTAEFTYTPSSPNPDDKITLDASGSSDSDGTITSYEWDGDGNGQYSEYRDPSDGQTSSITFGSAGTYTVGLQITDNGGTKQTITKQITVKNPGPTAEFTYTPSSPNPDDKITLDASGSSDSDGTITSYEWDGDGNGQYSEYRDPSDGQTSSISFGSAGTYTVGLRITDNGGTKQTAIKKITVKNPAPTAEFTYTPSSPNPDDKVTLDASGSSDSDGTITSYKWDGDGNGQYSEYRDPSDGQTSSITFGSAGTYTVGLRIIDNGGIKESHTEQITVKNPSPTAEFTYRPSSPDPGDTITLDASGSSDSDGTITSYEWDGDGNGQYSEYRDPGDGQTSSLSFDSAGTYTVGLRIVDNGGTATTDTKIISVGDSVIEEQTQAVEENQQTESSYAQDFDIKRGSPKKNITIGTGDAQSFSSNVDSQRMRNATMSLLVDGEVVKQSKLDSKNARATYQFEEAGEHSVTIEVSDELGNSKSVQWRVTSHPFNALPTFAEQSSSNQITLEGKTDLLTFAVQNPTVNDKDIVAEIVAEVPNGVSISAASDASSGSAAIQSTTQTISPGQQSSMRLSITVEDESLKGETISIPYVTRYYSADNRDVIYTNNRESLEVLIGADTKPTDSNSGSTSDSTPGFGPLMLLYALMIVTLSVYLKSRHRSNK